MNHKVGDIVVFMTPCGDNYHPCEHNSIEFLDHPSRGYIRKIKSDGSKILLSGSEGGTWVSSTNCFTLEKAKELYRITMNYYNSKQEWIDKCVSEL